MTDTVPAQITIIPLPDGVRYRLPPRDAGSLQLVGLGLFTFGFLLATFSSYWLWEAIEGLIHGPPDRGLLWLFLGIGILAPCLLAGLYLGRLGLFILAGHSEIELGGGMLATIERCGPVFRRRERSMANLRRFFVSNGMGHPDLLHLVSCNAIPLGVITPEWGPAVGGADSKSFWLAPAYPRTWLLPLAEDLAMRCQVTNKQPVHVEQKDPLLGEREELREQPLGSTVQVEQLRNGVRLTIPPIGVGHGAARNHVLIGLVVGIIASGLTAKLFDGEVRAGGFLLPGCGIAWAATFACLSMGFNIGRRAVELAAIRDTLIVREANLFGAHEREWPRKQLADVCVQLHEGDSDDPPHWELRILLQGDGRQEVALLGHRDPAELRWLATTLRQALRLEGDAQHSPPAGLIVRSTLPDVAT